MFIPVVVVCDLVSVIAARNQGNQEDVSERVYVGRDC